MNNNILFRKKESGDHNDLYENSLIPNLTIKINIESILSINIIVIEKKY